MTTAYDTAPAAPNGADRQPSTFSDYIERFFGSDTRAAAAHTAVEKAQAAKTALTVARTNLVATARAHPALTILALAGGVVALGLLANPATRRAAIAGGGTLWKTFGSRLTPLKLPIR